MLFNSYVFWVFFVIFFAIYKSCNHKWQNRTLLIASYVFYGWWDWRFLIMMAATTVFDFVVGQKIEDSTDPKVKKRWMLSSVVMNLSLLGFFKYCNFFIENAQLGLSALGFEVHPWTLHVILPVGISFYTFQEMSYIIDLYRGKAKAVRNLELFALFVAYFPQLAAGPIERSRHMIPQYENPRVTKEGDFAIGLYLIMFGLFKKIVIADNMATIVNSIFNTDPASLTGGECLIGVYAFAFQIYGDFSGYSAIAQGISRWIGIDLMDNFRTPYFSLSPSDFWTRWHISLSSWLRDYLYIPLGGSRGGSWQTYRNLMLTMLLGGFWHGAAWTFMVWGAFHGAILCIYRMFEKPDQAKIDAGLPGWQKALHMLLMFNLVCIGWLFFRAESMTQAGTFLAKMATDLTFTSLSMSHLAMIAFYTLPMLLLEFWIYMKDDLLAPLKVHWAARGLAYNYFALMILFLASEVAHDFIYFQF